MSLANGTHLGGYEVLAALGRGGMGEVYKARDTSLHRDVAIKILPEEFALDPERLARFDREAQLLAALNHPHIAQLYGIEHADGIRALVMELVDGPTLADRIARGPIPLAEALPIARQIAEALEAAHEAGIIHRDLKPSNIKVREDGTVKVLDFGLAKALDPVGQRFSPEALQYGAANSPTITSPSQMTGVGVILGTAAYMPPEQAKGRAVDKRADIWAFGCVLFEMLTGHRAFAGDDVSDTIAAVLRAEPEWTELSAIAPAQIVGLIEQCLRKDPRARVADIAVVRYVLDNANTPDDKKSRGAAVAPRRWWTAAAAAGAASIVAGAAVWIAANRAAGAPPHTTRFSIALPSSQPLLVTGVNTSLAIDPDGTRLTYVNLSQTLMTRAIDQLDVRALGTVIGVTSPFTSPDGRWVGFMAGGQLQKVSVNGGAPIALCRIYGWLRGASWGPDDTIVFATSRAGPLDGNISGSRVGLFRVAAAGGEPQALTTLEAGEAFHLYPAFLPGGRAVLFTVLPVGQGMDRANLSVVDLRSGRRKLVLRGGSQSAYLEPGYLMFAAGGALQAIRFNADRFETIGDPITVAEHLSPQSSTVHFAVSRSGTLVYAVGGPAQFGVPRTLVWVDRQGDEDPIAVPARTYTYPRISPDGSRVALDIRDQDNDIWIWDIARATLTRLTFDPGFDYYPVWTSDSRRVIYYSRGGNLFSQAADGTGSIEQLTTATTVPHYPYSISPDGKSLVFQENLPAGTLGISLLRLGDRRSEPLLQSKFVQLNAEVSPDGRWMAYQSSESGREEIYVRPFPNVQDGRWQVSTGGGSRPAWAHDGRELFYLDADGFLTTIRTALTPTFSAANPIRLLNKRYFAGFGTMVVAGRTYDVSADGQRFLMIKDESTSSGSSPTTLIVVENWVAELKRLLPRSR